MTASRTTRILSRPEVVQLTDMSVVVAAVETAFAAYARGEAQMPPKVYLDLPEYGGDFRAMPAQLGRAAGVKWVNSHPHNPARHGLPSVMGVYILSDPETAWPRAILDATWLTAVRTGAAAAVASRYLARPEAQTLGLIGAGVQARTLFAAHQVTHPGLSEVVVADISHEAAAALAAEIVVRSGGAVLGRVGTLADAAACDILCTSTPSRTPLVARAMVSPGTHINAIGADAEGKQELDPALLPAARVFVDDPIQALHSGEVNVAVHDGVFSAAQLAGTLGQVLTAQVPGRQATTDITLFDSTGLAIQDVAVAAAIVDRAEAEGVGIAVSLLG